MRNRLTLYGVLVCFVCYGQTQRYIAPTDTDPRIDANGYKHLVYINPTADKIHKLLVFLPGTAGPPAAYITIMKQAANMGYHVVGLAYPNFKTIASICANQSDSTCHSRARLEIIDGTERHAEIDVDQVNSIENRLLQVLGYLDFNYANENWSQFLNVQPEEVDWPKVVLAGHSQGAGHTGVMGKIRPVDRVIMFASFDMYTGASGPACADWLTMEGATAPSKYYAFSHLRDNLIPFEILQDSWGCLEMDTFGELINVDSTSNFGASHIFTTNAEPNGDSTKTHGAVAVSPYVPLDNQGQPLYAAIWNYLLGGNPLAVSEIERKTNMYCYPNPTTDFVNISSDAETALELHCYNSLGHLMFRKTILEKTHGIDFQNFPSGIYFLKIQTEGQVQEFKVVKM